MPHIISLSTHTVYRICTLNGLVLIDYDMVRTYKLPIPLPYACTRDKVINYVIIIIVVHTKIARSQGLCVVVSGQCHRDIKNAFKCLTGTTSATNYAF